MKQTTLLACGTAALLGVAALAFAADAAAPAAKAPSYAMPAKGEIPIIKQADIEQLLAGHGQRLLVVNHWATWCAPCVAELPYFQDAHEEFADDGVLVVGMGMDYHVYEEEWREYTDGTIADLGITFPQFQLDIDTTVTVPFFSEKWGGGIPVTFYYDAQGNKVGERLGEVTKEELYTDIARFLARTDKPSAPAPKE